MPKACAQLNELFKSKEIEKAMELQKVISAGDWPHTAAGIAGTKHVIQTSRGYGGVPRLPLQPLSAEKASSLDDRMYGTIQFETKL